MSLTSTQLERIATLEADNSQNKSFIAEIREKLHQILNIMTHNEETVALRGRIEMLQKKSEETNLRLTVLESEKKQEGYLRRNWPTIIATILAVCVTIGGAMWGAAHWVDTINATLDENSKTQKTILAEVQDLKQHER